MARNFIVYFVLFLVLTTTSGCSWRKKTVHAKGKQTIRWAVAQIPTCSSRFNWEDPLCLQYMTLVHGGVTRAALRNGVWEVTPFLAESISYPSPTVVVVTHRSTAKWADGSDLTSLELVESWKTVLSSRAPKASLLFPVKNAREYSEGRVPFSAVGIQAKGPKVLIFDLTRSVPNFALLLSHPILWPIKRQSPLTGAGTFIPVGNASTMKTNAKFERRPPHSSESWEEIEIAQVPLVTTRLEMYLGNEIDFLEDLPVSALPQISHHSDFGIATPQTSHIIEVSIRWRAERICRNPYE